MHVCMQWTPPQTRMHMSYLTTHIPHPVTYHLNGLGQSGMEQVQPRRGTQAETQVSIPLTCHSSYTNWKWEMYTCSIKCFCVLHPEVVTGPIHEHSLNHVFQPVIKQAYQTLPSLCVILKAICAGVGWVWLVRLKAICARVGWVWLARLKAGPDVILCSMLLHYSACTE